jgi:hypothetical protein
MIVCTPVAGLWEFPSQPAAAGAGRRERAAALDALLARLVPGVPTAGAAVARRANLGEVVHVFSHIRMTLRVETRLVEARACACIELGLTLPYA